MPKLLLGFLSSFVVGLAMGLWIGGSPMFASNTSADGTSEEAFYRGRPTSFWIRQLQDRDPAFRQAAIQALELIGPQEQAVVPAVASMLKDGNVGVRMGAAFALGRIGPEAGPALPDLTTALQDKNRSVRLTVVGALGSIGPQDEEVRAALQGALQDDDAEVRRAAGKALEKSAN
jgi:HEAT repeat protein